MQLPPKIYIAHLIGHIHELIGIVADRPGYRREEPNAADAERYHDTMVALGRLFGLLYHNDILDYVKPYKLGAPVNF